MSRTTAVFFFSITIADKLKNLQLLPFFIIRRSMLCYERCQYNRCFRKQVEMSTASHLFSFFISFFVVVPNIAALLTTNIRNIIYKYRAFYPAFFFFKSVFDVGRVVDVTICACRSQVSTLNLYSSSTDVSHITFSPFLTLFCFSFCLILIFSFSRLSSNNRVYLRLLLLLLFCVQQYYLAM